MGSERLGKLAVRLSQQSHHARILFEDQIEEVGLTDLTLSCPVDFPQLLAKDAVGQNLDDFFFGARTLEALGCTQALDIPFQGLNAGGSVLFEGLFEEQSADGRVEHQIVILLPSTHQHHFLQKLLQTLLVVAEHFPPRLHAQQQKTAHRPKVEPL